MSDTTTEPTPANRLPMEHYTEPTPATEPAPVPTPLRISSVRLTTKRLFFGIHSDSLSESMPGLRITQRDNGCIMLTMDGHDQTYQLYPASILDVTWRRKPIGGGT